MDGHMHYMETWACILKRDSITIIASENNVAITGGDGSILTGFNFRVVD